MSRKTAKSAKSETDAVDQAAKSEADNRSRLGPRFFTPASYRSRRKRRKAEKGIARTKTASSFAVFGRAVMTLRNHWEVFGGLFMIFGLINTLLTAGSLVDIDLAGTKTSLLAFDNATQLGAGLALFTTLLASGAGAASGAAGAYQMILVIIFSMAIVWALRQLSAGNKVRVRDALYNSTYPLVQVLLVVLMMFVRLLPVLAASFLISGLLSSGIIVVGWQQALVGFVCFLLAFWSVYMLIGSLFAAYIVTLPGMTPFKALRAAKDIVRYRRAMVLRKLAFLPFAILIIDAIILVPLSVLLPDIATIVFFFLNMACLPLVHAYLYTLYRELIT